MENESAGGEGESLSDSAELETQRIGSRLREIRQSRRMTLTVVAQKAKITPSFLSQIERGRAVPSIPALYRIARVFDFTPSDLLEDHGEDLPILTRRPARTRVETPAGIVKERLLPSAVRTMQIYSMTIPAGNATGESQSYGSSDELLLVLSGAVIVKVDEEAFRLGSGDSLYYRSSSIRAVHNNGVIDAEILRITAPPTVRDAIAE